ncbi:hypothetical protein [Mycolicibacterium hodleri]|uniref:hypothetical protein n=1 Tax=Mycolicibacterium hodleri TaxID=49897 RepID=UPI001F327130|nr:hypothetical protein [Mycolicibacterium hodleri]
MASSARACCTCGRVLFGGWLSSITIDDLFDYFLDSTFTVIVGITLVFAIARVNGTGRPSCPRCTPRPRQATGDPLADVRPRRRPDRRLSE